MEVSSTYKDEFHKLRTELFGLKFRLATQAKGLTVEEAHALRVEINAVKKAIADLIFQEKSTDLENGVKGGINK